MSFDKPIGFDDTNKDLVAHMGVTPVWHELKSLLPKGHKEPEPKILLPGASSFEKIRRLFVESSNAMIIPGQIWPDKNPLVSLLLDTKENGFPTAKYMHGHHSLRFRYEINPETGMMTQCDYNEKSNARDSVVIGGCVDRDEREHALRENESLKQGFNNFNRHYRRKGDPTFGDKVPFEQLHVLGGYIAARTEYGFAVKHPSCDVLFVFEACEDIFKTYGHDMAHSMSHLYEFEFEPKQIWGILPLGAQSPEAFRNFLYHSMSMICDHIVQAIPGSWVNKNSKAEFVKDHLKRLYGENEDIAIYTESLMKQFNKLGQTRAPFYTAEQFSLFMGDTLDAMLSKPEVNHVIYQEAARLHREKIQNNQHIPDFPISHIGEGAQVISLDSHRYASPASSRAKPVARVA